MMRRYVTIPDDSPKTKASPKFRSVSPAFIRKPPAPAKIAAQSALSLPCKTRFSGMEVTIDNSEIDNTRRESLVTPKGTVFASYMPSTEEEIGLFKNLPARRQYKYLRFLLNIAEEAEMLRNPPRGRELIEMAKEKETAELKKRKQQPACSPDDEGRAQEDGGSVGEMLVTTAKLQGYLLMGSGAILAIVLLLLLLLLAFQTRG